MDLHSLSYYIKELHLLFQQYKTKQEQNEHFNVFTTLLKPHDEVNLHSRFISSILDPHGCHCLGVLPLDIFLKTIHSSLSFGEKAIVRPNNKNWTEYHEIDILITDDEFHNAIIIENKITADDSNHESEGQIERYYKALINEKYSPDNVEIYYLTLDRHEPSTDSVNRSGEFPYLTEKVKCIDYATEITQFMQELAKEVYDKPYIRETINQYIKLLQVMTNDIDIDERIKLTEFIGRNDDNMAATKFLVYNFKHVCWHTIDNLFSELVSALEDAGFIIRYQPKAENITDIVHGGPLQRKKTHLIIKFENKNGIIWTLGTGFYHNNFYMGVDVEGNKKISKELKQRCKQYAEKIEFKLDKDWYFWEYIDIKNCDPICLWDFSEEATFDLISPIKRKKTVQKYIQYIKKECSKI